MTPQAEFEVSCIAAGALVAELLCLLVLYLTLNLYSREDLPLTAGLLLLSVAVGWLLSRVLRHPRFDWRPDSDARLSDAISGQTVEKIIVMGLLTALPICMAALCVVRLLHPVQPLIEMGDLR